MLPTKTSVNKVLQLLLLPEPSSRGRDAAEESCVVRFTALRVTYGYDYHACVYDAEGFSTALNFH